MKAEIMRREKDPLDKPDAIGTEIAIKAGVDSSGLTLAAKSRASTALDRLIGAAIDMPGVWLERRAERARIIAVTEQEAMKIDARRYLEQKNVVTESRDSAHSSFFKDLTRRIENKANVVSYALEEILHIQEPLTETEENTGDEYSLDDWLNSFSVQAEMASSDAMRSLLGRILAGELCKPSSFSVATLRIVAELDQKTARDFQNLCTKRVDRRFVPKAKDGFKKNEMLSLYDLEERGLIKEVGGNIHAQLQKNTDGFWYFIDGSKGLKFDIRPQHEYVPVSTILNFFLLTNAGEQLANILPHDDEAGLRAIGEQMAAHDAVKFIELLGTEGDETVSIEILLDRREHQTEAASATT